MNTCPKCGGRTEVKESRHIKPGLVRRRFCEPCQLRVMTVEAIVEIAPVQRRISERIESTVSALEAAWALMKKS